VVVFLQTARTASDHEKLLALSWLATANNEGTAVGSTGAGISFERAGYGLASLIRRRDRQRNHRLPQLEHGFRAVDGPAGSGDVHAVSYEVSAGPFDDAAGYGPPASECCR